MLGEKALEEGDPCSLGGLRAASKQKSMVDIKVPPTAAVAAAAEKLTSTFQGLSCFAEMPERWAEVTETRSGAAHVDNEFLELYGGLQAHHEEKRQAHFLQLKQPGMTSGQASLDSNTQKTHIEHPEPVKISPEDVSTNPGFF